MEAKMQEIVAVRIHPGIGIARLGNSESEFFVGPEAPGHTVWPEGGFKDSEGKIKRQAARFRVYGLDREGNVVAELTAKDATITWTVHLANKKGAFYRFSSDPTQRETKLRNAGIQPGLKPDDRTDLIIDPGPRTISGCSEVSDPFSGGRYRGVPVGLGELRTDADGHLLVLGGAGMSDSVTNPVSPIVSSYNNDGWYDDTADGPVTAKIELVNGTTLAAEPAWVIVAPPNFAPSITNLVSLYQRVNETLELGIAASDTPVSYRRDVRPLLARLALYSWVNKNAMRGHGPGKPGDFLAPYSEALLTAKTPEAHFRRQQIVERLRVPFDASESSPAAREQANYFFMPQLAGDCGDPVQEQPATWMTFLPSQYGVLRRWADGDFEIGVEEEFPPFEAIPIAVRPSSLDRAALEPCVGAPLCPGIEMTYISEQPETFRVENGGSIRIASSFGPGDVTRYMALPWQADFHDCFDHWWPAQRPDDVLPEEILERFEQSWQDRTLSTPVDRTEFIPKEIKGEEIPASLVYRLPWSRGMPTSTSAGGEAMVRYWSELGFIKPKKTRQGEVAYVETERSQLVGLDARTLFYQLTNVDNHLDCLSKARDYVEHYLAKARQLQDNPDTPNIWWTFDFTPDALDARLMEVYNDLADNAAFYDPATDPLCRSRDDVIEWLWQWGPFNMTDGAWLRNVNRAGPLDEVHTVLFSILCDEMGNGHISRSHANMARDLLHSVGRYPEPVGSQAFANDQSLLDSAFTVPTFALAISEFTEHYLPEIIGMTLFLEWCVLDLKPSVALLKYYDVDPHFYVLHVGIDNASDGHGHLARKAVEIYLDSARLKGGESAVQEHWKRIWDGFVAYGTTGTFGNDLAKHMTARLEQNRSRARERAIALIEHKAPFGQLNHGTKMIGTNRINDWFRDPPAFLDALVEANYVIPSDPDNSALFKLFQFDGGPMYNVFSPEEIGVWRNWVLSLVAQLQATPVPPAQGMLQLIDHLRTRQAGAQAHQEMTLRIPGSDEALPVSAWFERPAEAFMTALADPDNGWIEPGNPGSSAFVTELLSDRNAMGRAFDDVIADTGGQTGRAIIVAWIEAGCPLPARRGDRTGRTPHLWLHSHARVRAAHPTGEILGMGGAH